MVTPVSSADEMIGGMNPELRPGRFVFCTLTASGRNEAAVAAALATFREEEGLSLLLPEELASAHGLAASEPMRQITLNVYSSLSGVGLTAAVSTALAKHGIACNMIAATLHDHAFVPADRADEALQILQELQARDKA